jgi:predicted metal-dependent hydrolase
METVEQIYERVFRSLKPRSAPPRIAVRFRRYANANSRIRLNEDGITVDISDLLERAPAPVQEALAFILLGKLYRKPLEPDVLSRYRRYLNRSDMRNYLHAVKRERGRKIYREAKGRFFDLCEIFAELNDKYFAGSLERPKLGWSTRPSRTTLGHYDPCHHVIVLSSILDDREAPDLIVRFVVFHEMLHLKYPTHQRGARRCVHTKQFKAAEKEFAEYDQAKTDLRRFIEGLDRRPAIAS